MADFCPSVKQAPCRLVWGTYVAGLDVPLDDGGVVDWAYERNGAANASYGQLT